MKKIIRFNVLLTIFAVSLVFIAAKSPTPRFTDIVFIPNPVDCRSYFAVELIAQQVGHNSTCRPGCQTIHYAAVETNRILLRCPSGLRFNPQKLLCEPAYLVPCNHYPPCPFLE